jgi:SAM-dependent methyltransferase
MLNRHLYAYAQSVDERRFTVAFRDDRSTLANRDFAEVEEDVDESSETYWNWYYPARLAELGIDVPRGAAILDCACGIGRLGDAIRRRSAPRSVTFCDLSIDQLRAVRGGSAQLADVCRMPYADASFDLVIGNSFLHHLADVPAALREMYRVCKPGGVVAVLHEPNVYAPFWEAFPVSLYKNMYRHPNEGNFTDLWCFAPDDLRALLHEVGFAGVRLSSRGVLAAIVANAYLILLRKLRVRAAGLRVPVYRLRVLLDRVESALTRGRGLPTAPSLSIVARKAPA